MSKNLQNNVIFLYSFAVPKHCTGIPDIKYGTKKMNILGKPLRMTSQITS